MGGMNYTVVDSKRLATAEIYGKTLCELGEKDRRVVALTADLAGSTKIGDFREKFPERFFNVGIAEQNLFGIAAGMAKTGLIPFISTFSVFASMPRLQKRKVRFITSGKLTQITEKGITVENVREKTARTLEMDNVVLSIGLRPENSLYRELEGKRPNVYVVGDAEKAGRIAQATRSAYEVAMKLN